jgi:hypothetical protein
VDDDRQTLNHHRQVEEFLLDLPCDWRFLPKLGPLRFGARAFPFLPTGKARCHLILSEIGREAAFLLRPHLVRRSIILQRSMTAEAGSTLAWEPPAL